MKHLVVGASGATGRLLVQQLLERGETAHIVVREAARLPPALTDHSSLSVNEGALLDLDDRQLAQLVDGCSAVASCLGHNLTFGGMFGPPRRLVTDATRRLCAAIRDSRPAAPVRFVLMNTNGNHYPDEDPPRALRDRLLFALLRGLLPPHADNEQAAAFLRSQVGRQHAAIEWAAVRPDSLVDAASVSPYELHGAQSRSAIFESGATSRINVAHFMAELMSDDDCWAQWKGRMPVIHNRDQVGYTATR